MLTIRLALITVILLCLVEPARPADSSEFHLGMDIGASYVAQSNYLDRGTSGLTDQRHFNADRSYSLLTAEPFFSFSLREGIAGYVQADIDWEQSDDPETDESVQVELANAYLSLSKGRANADLGLQTVSLGNGLVMLDDVPAAVLGFTHGKGYGQITLARVLDSSPMTAATIGFRPGDYEHAALFGIWFQDHDDAFARAIPRIYQVLPPPRSKGDLYWVGISADLFVGGTMLSAVGAYQWGQFRLYYDNADAHINVSAFLADLSVEGNLADWCSLGAFIFVAGGDDTPLRNDLNAFVSIMPFNPRAAIFFDPRFLDRDEDDEKLTFNGGFFGGVIAPGLTLNIVSPFGISLETTVTTFYSHKSLDDGSRWYGWEVDLGLSFNFDGIYTLYAEAARFQHGDYYESLLNEPMDPAMRFTLGLRASF